MISDRNLQRKVFYMEDYYCPTCFNKLERLSGCGTVGYMCNTCKHLVSKQKILSEQDMSEMKIQRQHKNDPEE
jgi:hypothetical protein